MTFTDPIGDMFSRIRNGQMRSLNSVAIPSSNFRKNILEINKKLNKVKVKAVNMIKKHLKPTKENKGGIVPKESFIHQSNVKNLDKKIQKKGVAK